MISPFDPLSSLSYQGLPIEYHLATGLVCLTDIWRAQCSPASQRPLAWVRQEATQKLLKRLAQQSSVDPLWSQKQHPGQKPEQLIVAIPGILETNKVDGDLRTYATTDLAVVYAFYLAQECYEWTLVNLTQETTLVKEWSAQQQKADVKQQRLVFTRRAVIAAGWSIPVVTALALNQRVAAQVSPGRSNTGNNTTGTNNTGASTGTNTVDTGTNTGVGTGTTTGVGTGTNTGVGTGTTTGVGTTGTTSGLGTGTTSGLGTGTTSGLGTGTTSGLGTTGTTNGLGTTGTTSGLGTTGTTSGLGTTGTTSGLGTTGTTSGLGTGTTTGVGTGTNTGF